MKFGAFVLCVLACLVQIISCKCIGGLNPGYGSSYGYNPFGPPINPAIGPGGSLPCSNGGGFPVTSTSPIVPTGLSILSENLAIDGGVAVGGQIPFLGTVAMDGVLPTVGAGVVTYGCGDGAIGILSEGSIAPKATIAPKSVITPKPVMPPKPALVPKAGITPKTTKSPGLGYRGFKQYGSYK